MAAARGHQLAGSLHRELTSNLPTLSRCSTTSGDGRRFIIFLSSSPTAGNNKLERLYRADLFLSWGRETKSFVWAMGKGAPLGLALA
jgi:hypothetical protein